ncbi:MAG: cell wall-binding repeat-containing protein [Parcubacteria group bacterium]
MHKLLSIFSAALLVSLTLSLTLNVVQPAQAAGGPVDLVRLAGPDRLLTAVDISQESFPADNSAQAVYLYNSDNPVDALAAVPLTVAHPNNIGPLLPVKGGLELTAEVRAELDRVLCDTCIVEVLGGMAAISQTVFDSLDNGSYFVERIGGKDRFVTAAIIAERVRSAIAPNVPDLFIVNGYAMADALAIGPYAGNFDPAYQTLSEAGGVVLFTYEDAVPTETLDFIDGQSGGFISLVGGPAVLDESIGAMLSQRHYSGSSSNYGRFGGANRYFTAQMIAAAFTINNGALANYGVGLANGETMVDALPAGPLLARSVRPLLLTDSGENLNCAAAQYLEQHQNQLKDGYIFGGTAVVTNTAEQQAEALLNQLTNASNLGC